MFKFDTHNLLMSLALASLLATTFAQEIDKATWADGLGGGTSPYYTNTGYDLTQEGDTNGCDMNTCTAGGQTATVYRAAYYDGSAVKICVCEGAAMDQNYVATNFGVVPQMIRQYTQFITIASQGLAGCGAYSTGASSTYCLPNMETEVFIHESAHNFDISKFGDGQWISGWPDWQDAIDKDGCVPDGYAQTNKVEDFAQVVVLWMALAAQNSWIDCMANQLTFVESQVPRDSLLANMKPQ